MRMCIIAAPGGDLAPHLLAVLEAVALANQVWLAACEARGLAPPCCTACADPPWVVEHVRYVEHHGAPVGTSREYLDGPSMFARGKGTCADIVAYDAAVQRHRGHDARIVLERLPDVGGAALYHAVLYVDGVRADPSAEIAARDKQHNVGGGCGCARSIGT